ncbi:uncharacterized protein [Pocillopora verrucosa]|uniref:uncharacterized protein isoform X1 n=1 Tax=Pocillopora verrucosa TaxID=203993 RepID=UPI00333F08D7
MERQSRLVYSEEQKEVLTTFFNEGMTSTKKAMCDKIRACATRVGISEDQVKHWINNHNAKCSSGSRVLDGHKRTEKKLVRKQSGFNAFTREFLHKEQTGGSAEVFRTIREKWRNLSDSDRDAYKKVATDLGSAVSLPSADKQAKKIIGNIMKQVAELETLGGHALMLCAYDGVCYQGSAGIGDSLLKTNIMETFASRLHCNSLVEKQDVSVKHLQEVFNFKYSMRFYSIYLPLSMHVRIKVFEDLADVPPNS